MIDAFSLAPLGRGSEVRVLARSLAGALPGARFTWVPVGPPEDADATELEHGEIVPLRHLCGALPGRTMADPALALPAAASALLGRPDCEGVLFLAPSLAVLSSLSRLFAREQPLADVALVPSVVRPEAAAAGSSPDAELAALRHGVFSTALVAVRPSPNGRAFLRWWSERAHEFVTPPDDHRALRPWLNLAPALFAGVRVLRSPGWIVGAPHLHARRVEGVPPGGLTVDGQPLVCFDFAGHDDGSLERAIIDGRGDRGVLACLADWYRGQLVAVHEVA